MGSYIPKSRKRIVAALLVPAVVALGIGIYFYLSRDQIKPTISTARVTRGEVTQLVSATGTLQPVHKVDVGSQVSGMVKWLGADYNSIVRKDQVIARLDSSIIEQQIAQARAGLSIANTNVLAAQTQLASVQLTFERTKALSAQQIVSQTDLEAAQLDVQNADAELRSAKAQVTQAQTQLQQGLLNLDHTVIKAPLDGVVVSRSVDVGQTVSASASAPTLFTIAEDLRNMQVSANLDESDVGGIRSGQPMTFSVDAYPGEQFSGWVTVLRLDPVLVQNVTTYTAVLGVANPEMKLRPGMTATVNIEIAKRADATLVPNAALGFHPSQAMFAALGQSDPSGSRERGKTAKPTSTELTNFDEDSIEALSPSAGVVGHLWVLADGRLESRTVRLGITDGLSTELMNGELHPGDEVVTRIEIPRSV